MIEGALSHLNSGGNPAQMAEAVVAKTGMDPGMVQQLLPSIMGFVQGHADSAAPEAQGFLGGLLRAL
jgi:hypothetical protein